MLKTEYPDYINATFVDVGLKHAQQHNIDIFCFKGYKERKKFIIAQSPLQNTTRDFWKMVYERNCGSIVMLCGMVEDEEVCMEGVWQSQGGRNGGREGACDLVTHQRNGGLGTQQVYLLNWQEVCYKYWPTRGIDQYGEYDVSLLEQTMHDGFLERTYSVTDSKVSRREGRECADVSVSHCSPDKPIEWHSSRSSIGTHRGLCSTSWRS